MSKHQICNNCVMDTSDTKIKFNKDGVCDHCQTFYTKIKPKWHNGEKGHKKLLKIVKKIKKGNQQKGKLLL